MYQRTTAYKKIKSLHKRIRALPGGTSASKTVSVVMWLIALAQADKKPTVTSIVSESFPHLRRGVMRDFLMILKEHKYYDDKLWDRTNSVYTFETGSQIEFFSVDQPEKVRGARRDRLFINEANNIPFNAFEELEVRTKEFIFLDWNPTNEFWYYTEVKDKRSDVEEITLTYLDNEALASAIVASIESRKNRPSWFDVYGLGKLGVVEGRILSGWNIIDEVPHEARLERHTLDPGYTNDETASVDIYSYNGGYIWDEILYQKGLQAKPIADFLLNQAKMLTIADSADPRLIDEIQAFGVNITGVAKTQGETKSDTFVKWSFGVVQNERISVTKRSTNLIKEYRNLLWMQDKNGKFLNVEDPMCKNHAVAAGRYGMVSLVPMIRRKEMLDMMPRYEKKERTNPAF